MMGTVDAVVNKTDLILALIECLMGKTDVNKYNLYG